MSVVDYQSILERIRRKFWVIDSVVDRINREKAVKLGVTGPLIFRRPFTLRGKNLFTHKHIIGKTGYGKSNLIASLIKQLVEQDIAFCLIDPHSDLATSCLWNLYDSGYFNDPRNKEKLMYIDFGVKDELDNPTHFLPFNVLEQPYEKYKIARNFVECCRRVWPYLAEGAPQFENILLNAIIVLIDNDLPLIHIQKVLSEKSYRDTLLEQVTDEDVVSFFRHRYDRWGKDGYLMIESTLNKITLLTFSPVLKYSLGQRENALNFRRIINEGISVIFNLGGLDEETQRFLGCLLTINFETATLFRENIPEWERKEYFFVLDEFQQFTTTSQKSFNKFLSEARKYKTRLVLAHQYLSQLPPQLQDALQNTMRISLRLEDDAIHIAERIGKYDPEAIRREVEDEETRKRTLPHDKTVQEEYEEFAREIKELYVGEAYVKLEDRTEKIKTQKFPRPTSSIEQLKALERMYRDLLMKPKEALVQELLTRENNERTQQPVFLGKRNS